MDDGRHGESKKLEEGRRNWRRLRMTRLWRHKEVASCWVAGSGRRENYGREEAQRDAKMERDSGGGQKVEGE